MIEPSGASKFLLNGMAFDPSRTDVTMKLGSLERWTLVNTTREWHTFHMHINDFQVVSQNGVAVPYVDDEDNVALPPGLAHRRPGAGRATSPAGSSSTAT